MDTLTSDEDKEAASESLEVIEAEVISEKPKIIQFFSLEQPLVGWQLPANFGDGALWQALCVFYNPTGQEKTVPLPEGSWKLLSDGISSSLWRGESQIRSGQTVLLPTSATIFGKA